ncbi:sulfite exporter TauE/SafE family protein [Gymnodinialimonas sp. 57CJ19]|uniref:sulfite exporter TauE/SafE family protein n=1 Tax=Gymnodinialimonas sp. 57CJ19 TaxID=3138498 RepID=UPI00313437D6
MIDLLILLAAAFGAGVLNTIAGGGTFLTFPALVMVGVPPVAANATSAVAVFPGYLAGALGFREELASYNRARLLRLSVVALAGAAVGSGLLLVSSNEAFSAVVPFLLLASTLAFLYGERIRAFAAARARGVTPEGAIGLFLVAVYGGYFNGGLGIVLLALFALWGMRDIHRMNGLKNGLSFVISLISVGIFAAAGLVAWPYAIAMMIAATLGGYAGAPLARRLPKQAVRGLIGLIGFGMSGVFLWRLIEGA